MLIIKVNFLSPKTIILIRPEQNLNLIYNLVTIKLSYNYQINILKLIENSTENWLFERNF